MHIGAGMDLLTTSEAADYLRLGERKVYELVAANEIPCSKVTGKWLFPRHELDRWVLSELIQPTGMIPAEPAANRRRQSGRSSGMVPAPIGVRPGLADRR